MPSALIGPETANHLKSQVPDLLAQRITVKTEQVRGTDLVASCSAEAEGQKGARDVLEDAVIEARGWQGLAVFQEILRQMPLYGGAQRCSFVALLHADRPLRLLELGRAHACRNRLAGMQHGEAANKVLELADIAGPAITPE